MNRKRKAAYIHARISDSDYHLAQMAADYLGENLSTFLSAALRQRTRQTIGQALLELTPEQRALVLNELGPEGRDMLQEMHERYSAKLRELSQELAGNEAAS